MPYLRSSFDLDLKIRSHYEIVYFCRLLSRIEQKLFSISPLLVGLGVFSNLNFEVPSQLGTGPLKSNLKWGRHIAREGKGKGCKW